MPWIETLGPEDDKTLASIYRTVKSGDEPFPEFLELFTLKPRVLQKLMLFENSITFGGSSLGRRLEELISFYVSVLNECKY